MCLRNKGDRLQTVGSECASEGGGAVAYDPEAAQSVCEGRGCRAGGWPSPLSTGAAQHSAAQEMLRHVFNIYFSGPFSLYIYIDTHTYIYVHTHIIHLFLILEYNYSF